MGFKHDNAITYELYIIYRICVYIMLKSLMSNSRIQTITLSLLGLFTVTQSLKYMNLYEGLENNDTNFKVSDNHSKIARTYGF